MRHCSDAPTKQRDVFEVAEARPVSEQHLHQASLLQHRWLRRGSSALAGLRTVRYREDWREALLNSSSAAKHQLRCLVSPQVTARVLAILEPQ